MSPAHSSGATWRSGQSPGRSKQKRSSATAYSAKPPSMSHPVKRARTQRFSRPLRQYSQTPHVQPSQGTPTRRPPGSTVATIWWPRMRGGAATGTSPSSRCRSVRQTPQASTRRRSWPAAGRGGSRWTARSGRPTSSKTIARTRDADALDVGAGHRPGVLEAAVAVARDDVLVGRDLPILGRVQAPLELAEHDAEDDVTPRRLGEGAPARGQAGQLVA